MPVATEIEPPPIAVIPELFSMYDDESFYRTLVQHSLDVITVVDRRGVILFSSPSVETVLGYLPENQVGRHVFDFVHPEDLPHARVAFEAAVGSEELSPAVIYRCRHRDGRWLNFESFGRYQSQLEMDGVGVIVSRDVTERTRLEEQFRRAQRLEVVGRMTAALTHDFNNLLTSIIGQSDLMIAGGCDPNVESSVQEIRKAALSAAALTRRLLSFARQGTAPSNNPTQAVDANHVVAELAAIFERLVGTDVRLTCRLHSAHHVAAIGHGQLEQVLINLLVNAKDALPAGGAITITTRDAAAGECAIDGLTGSHLVIEVTDDGVGMTADVRARIFDPFFTTKPSGKGTGLGLFTVAEIVEQAQGGLEVESAAGRGSTFRLRLRPARGSAAIAAMVLR